MESPAYPRTVSLSPKIWWVNSGEKLDSLSLPGVLTEGGAKKSDRSKGTKKHAEWGMKWHVTQKDGSHIVGLDHPFLLPANNLIKVWVCVNERTNESKKSCRKSLKKRTKEQKNKVKMGFLTTHYFNKQTARGTSHRSTSQKERIQKRRRTKERKEGRKSKRKLEKNNSQFLFIFTLGLWRDSHWSVSAFGWLLFSLWFLSFFPSFLSSFHPSHPSILLFHSLAPWWLLSGECGVCVQKGFVRSDCRHIQDEGILSKKNKIKRI